MSQSGSAVRDARLRRGWTLHQLAEQCSGRGVPVAPSTLGRIERGAVPRPSLRAALAEELELDVVADFEREAS